MSGRRLGLNSTLWNKKQQSWFFCWPIINKCNSDTLQCMYTWEQEKYYKGALNMIFIIVYSGSGVLNLWAVAHYLATAYWPRGCVSGWPVGMCALASSIAGIHGLTRSSIATSIVGICGPMCECLHHCEHYWCSWPHSCKQCVFVCIHACEHAFIPSPQNHPFFPPCLPPAPGCQP